MNNQIKTNASSGIETSEVRYQKALKQINKLINVNNQLQQVCNKQLQTINGLNQKLQMQEQLYKNVVDERNQLWSQVNQLKTEKLFIMKENQELRKQSGKHRGTRVSIDLENKKKQVQCNYVNSLSYEQLQRNMMNGDKVRDQSISQSQKAKKNQQVINGQKNSFAQGKHDHNNNQLIKRLTIANSFIDRVNAENVELKSKLVRAQSNNRLLNAKSMQCLPKYTPEITPRVDTRLLVSETRNSAEVLKKLHKLQEQNKRLTKRYQHGKVQIQKLLQQIKKLKKQHTQTNSQITKYQALITKHQNIIEELHLQYDKQIHKMTEQFKKKLIDQRQSFSPTKNSDLLKQIQNLQAQNKTLKKKINLFSAELTKCFKTLQKYKIKLSECQQEYSDLINERNQLSEKINRLQSSNRDKSSHSRSSTTKLAAPDYERRNSMGETGHFNMN